MTDWSGPVAVTLPPGSTPFNRLASLLGHYDFRVYVSADAYIDIGAGSLPTIERVDELDGQGLLGTIGRYCDVNTSAKIQAWGVHDHDKPVNVTFGGFPLLKPAAALNSLKPRRPFKIGNGVVISANAIVLAGADIGDGAVVGAGAVVTKPLEPFGIYAGAPAALLRTRPTSVPWWDFSVSYLLANGSRLNEVVNDRTAIHAYRSDQPRFVLNAADKKFDLVGFLEAGEVRPFSAAPKAVVEYVVQAVQAEKPYWLADCWSAELWVKSNSAA